MVGSQEFVKDNPFPKHKAPKEITQKFEKAISWLKTVIVALEKTENKKDNKKTPTQIKDETIAEWNRLKKNKKELEEIIKIIK
jgi:exonuclease VII small subunit